MEHRLEWVISDFYTDIKEKPNLCVSGEKDINVAILNIFSFYF